VTDGTVTEIPSLMNTHPDDRLQVRVHGDPTLPTLIYLPGVHGDWTLVSSFRAAVTNHFRFVEFTYPRTEEWSLDDYAAGIESALRTNGITHGWLLGESFGSQVVWALLAREQARAGAKQEPPSAAFKADGVILAGGFVRHPLPWGARCLGSATARTPQWCLKAGLLVYAQYARFRHRRAPETLGNIQEFVQRRQDPDDRRAMRHRLTLIAEHDPRSVARQTQIPVFALAGLVDPLVPNPGVWWWLKKNCPGYRASRMIWRGDHNVLGTAPKLAADQVERWVQSVTNAPTQM
jgi:pimeloyl-ACP methyl ester carboxylesterase